MVEFTETHFKRFTWTLCALIALYQSITIMIYFTQKPYVVSSTTQLPDVFKLPAISICAHSPLYDRNYYKMFDNSIPANLIGKTITWREHYNQSLIPDLVSKCVVLLPDLTTAECEEITKVKIYVNKQTICYTYFDQEMMNDGVNYHMTIVDGFMMFEIVVNSKGTRDDIITLVIHDHKLRPVPYFSSSGSVDINVNETSAAYVLVDINIVRMVSAPPEACIEYRSIGFRNIEDCLTMCYFRKVVNKTGKWPGEIFGTINSRLDMQALEVDMDHFSSVEKFNCSANVCNRRQCEQSDFSTVVRNRVLTDKSGSDRNTLSINIGTPFIKETIIDFQKQMTFNQILSQIGGLFSLWTGLSLTALIASFWESGAKLGKLLADKRARNLAQSSRLRRVSSKFGHSFTYGVDGDKRLKLVNVPWAESRLRTRILKNRKKNGLVTVVD